ncbi:MAG TPA: ABC transporter ATP-binding protein [Gemmatimonadota bacterium]|nr:ABC transporter ATP-binding protein [Gemmatimonadota bacterium]
MIRVRNLTRRFDGVTAVQDLSFDVAPGEILGLLGPNGAGKTTTLRMLAALISPTAGEATVCGHRLGEDDPGVRRSIGLLTETPGLYDRLSARKNLEVYARLHGVADPAGRAGHYLELLDLGGRREEPVGTFSRGMRQKLALARALLHEPRVLLLDEPTAGLDPRIARLVRDWIEELRQGGRTILLSTHNLEEAERLCDRVALLRTRLVALDRPAALRGLFSGGRTIVRLAQPDGGIRFAAALRALPFVTEVEAQGDALVVSVDQPEEDTPALVRALVEAGAEVIEVSPERRTLEEAYLQLMTEGPS